MMDGTKLSRRWCNLTHSPILCFIKVIDIELIGISQPPHSRPCLLPIGGIKMESKPLIHIQQALLHAVINL